MKKLSLMLLSVCLCVVAFAQTNEPKLVIVTLDGCRWKEVFRGADSSLLMSHEYNPSKIR